MKILIVTTVSGTLNFFEKLLNEMYDEGYEIHLASNFKVGDIRYDTSRFKKHQVDFSRKMPDFANLQSRNELKKIIETEEFDIVHTHTPIASAIVRTLNIRKKRCNIIYTAHGYHFYKGANKKNWLLFYPIEKYLSRFTEVIININAEDFNITKKNFKMKKNYLVKGVGIEVGKFSRFKKRNTIIQFVSIGELNNNKNHEFVIRSLAHLENKNFKYIIIGQGSKYDELQALINSLGLEREIKLLGRRDDVPNLLAESDVFIFPSKREGLPVSVQEAMASGLPVIASDIRGNRDLINNKHNGYLIDTKDYKDFLYAVELLQDSKNFKTISNNNMRDSLVYDVEDINKIYLSIYEEVKNYDKCY